MFEENWQTVQLFIKLGTQWAVTGMGDFIGLNYASVEFLFKLYDINKPREVFEDLRLMELSALKKLREARD